MYLTKDKKSKIYHILYYVNGKKHTKSTGKKKKSEALHVMMHDFYIPQEVVTDFKLERILISDYFKLYKDYIKVGMSENYLGSVCLSFRKLLEFTKKKYLDELTPRELEQFINFTFSRAKYAALLYFRTLKAAFSRAVLWEYLETNPMKKIKPPKVQKKLPLFISMDELQLIVGQSDSQMMKDIFIIAYYTGLRLGEIVHAKWNWIDLDKNIITTKITKNYSTKSKKERIIPMAEKVREIIHNYYSKRKTKNDDTYIFTRIKDVRLNEDYVSRAFKLALRKTELNEKIHFHTLRHSFASALVQRGVSIYVVKELMGHQDITTTQIYSHLKEENLYEAICKL